MRLKCWLYFQFAPWLIARTEISYISVKFQRGKIPALLRKREREREVNMRIQRNQKQVETSYDLSTVDIHIAHTGLTYIQSD